MASSLRGRKKELKRFEGEKSIREKIEFSLIKKQKNVQKKLPIN